MKLRDPTTGRKLTANEAHQLLEQLRVTAVEDTASFSAAAVRFLIQWIDLPPSRKELRIDALIAKNYALERELVAAKEKSG